MTQTILQLCNNINKWKQMKLEWVKAQPWKEADKAAYINCLRLNEKL